MSYIVPTLFSGSAVFTPLTGSTVTIPNTYYHYNAVITPAGELASLSIVLPPSSPDGTYVTIIFNQPIAALTWSGAAFTGTTGTYNILFGTTVSTGAEFTNGSTTVTFSAPVTVTADIIATNTAISVPNTFNSSVRATTTAKTYTYYQSRDMYLSGFSELLKQCRALSVWQPGLTKTVAAELVSGVANWQQDRNDAIASLRDGMFDPLVTSISGAGTKTSAETGIFHFDGDGMVKLGLLQQVMDQQQVLYLLA